MPATKNASFFKFKTTKKIKNWVELKYRRSIGSRNFSILQSKSIPVFYTAKTGNRSKFNFRSITDVQDNSIFCNRQTAIKRNNSNFQIRKTLFSKLFSKFSTRFRSDVTRVRNYSKNYSLFPDGFLIIAKDLSTGTETELGFIDGDTSPITLTDVTIADGSYKIYLKRSSLFWDNCQDGKSITVVISGGYILNLEPPRILNLRRDLEELNNTILWEVTSEYTAVSDLYFGLWYSATTPVNISGIPDETKNYFTGQIEYEHLITQTSNQYLAVALTNGTITGEATELYIDWNTAGLISPRNQIPEENFFLSDEIVVDEIIDEDV